MKPLVNIWCGITGTDVRAERNEITISNDHGKQGCSGLLVRENTRIWRNKFSINFI